MTSAIHNDATALQQALSDWYTAIEQHDLTRVADFLTDDFVMVEHTEILSKAELMARLTLGVDYGTQTSQLADFKATFHHDLAWATLRNIEVWTPNDGSKPVDLAFVETALFQWVDGQWLLKHYHATNTNPDVLNAINA